ncbi:MAG: DEAD/DEAH box helicase [Candidatus Lambdaproteobacteria bacterium]|nr:DEAD/DEAH box helicase [Candidatus Lambdaproteobacteria bacterium]
MLAASSIDPIPSYTDLDVERTVTHGAWSKAKAYVRQGRVQSYRVDKCRGLTGAVQGSARRPYQVHVHVTPARRGGATAIDGECSCPLGGNCKHVAALLLYVLVQRNSPVGTSARRSEQRAASGNGARQMALPMALPVALPMVEHPPLLDWLERLDDPGQRSPQRDHELFYVIGAEDWAGDAVPVRAVRVPRLKHGSLGKTEKPVRLDFLWQQKKQWGLEPQDLSILTLLRDEGRVVGGAPGAYHLHGESGVFLLERMLATGRCRWGAVRGPALRQGPSRRAEPAWAVEPNGTQRLVLAVAQGGRVFPLVPAWYVDADAGECGALEHELPEPLLAALRQAPPLAPHHAPAVRAALAARPTGRALPLPRVFAERRVRAAPVPEVHLFSASATVTTRSGYFDVDKTVELAFVGCAFDYAGHRVRPHLPGDELRTVEGDELVVIERNRNAEARLVKRLYTLGFLDYPEAPGLAEHGRLDADFVLAEVDLELGLEQHLLPLLHRELPRLEAEGWRVTVDNGLPVRLARADADWSVQVEQPHGENWFGLSLGITVDGERVELLPILLQALQRDGGWEALRDPPADGVVFAQLPGGAHVALPAIRLRAVLGTLLDLVGAEESDGGMVRLPRARARLLADLEVAGGQEGFRWQGGESLRELGRRLHDLRGLPPVEPPRGLRGELRPYQREGLGWLQFLRDYEFGGILADEMGLGKTVQALAHVLVEQEAGRLDRPCLVVAPTSLMGTWQEQAARFAPSLRVLLLHGLERKADFPAIAAHDLVLTSYALLHRDEAVHLAQPYHLVILDEAQYLKNPETHVARIAGALQSRFRLCLTGTPMENHLGELWSIMQVLMPGLLGSRAWFRRTFQIPVEKRGETALRQALARRVAPFLLRRGKDEVAPELPPKTVIPHAVTLEGRQRELYETVRLAMHKKVRAALAAKGLERSRIIVLDALLKLRQVCCDPRLVKLPSVREQAPSAKLARLLELLPELVEGGRRILLYSQFTSMLALIEPELARLRLGYVKLTGKTKDRDTPIGSFQAGEVPLFLLSLKAGGTGLNLTAADTVIHYDPWWNPAVEHQATDRAHRIGQDKPVFVHKLLAAGTVEERIAAMQERKGELLQALFAETGRAALRLTGEELEGLFAPLPA